MSNPQRPDDTLSKGYVAQCEAKPIVGKIDYGISSQQMQVGTYRPNADKVTVGEACESFLEHCSGRNERDERMTRKMLTVYRGHVNNHILHSDHGLGSRKLSQLTARSVGDFRDGMRGVGVTVPTARKILATLHSVLAYAISQDWVATNAAHGTRVIGPRDEGSKKIVPPSKRAGLKNLNRTISGVSA